MFKESMLYGILRGLGALLGFACSLIAVRVLGESESGYFFFYLSVITFLSVALSFGMPDFVIKKISLYFFDDKNSEMNAVVYSSFGVLMAGGAAMLLLKESIFYFYPSLLNGIYGKLINEHVLSVVFMMYIMVFSSFFQAIRKLFFAIFFQNILLPISFILMVFIVEPEAYDGFIKIYTHAMILTLIMSAIFWHFLVGFKVSLSFKGLHIFDSFSYYFSRLFSSLNANVSVLLVSYFGSLSEVSYVSICTKLISILSLVLVTTNMMFAPNMSILYSKKELEALKLYTQKASFVVFILVSPFCATLFFASDQVLSLFGPNFVEANSYLMVMLGFQFISICCGPVNSFMNMCGLERLYKNIIVYSSFFSFLILFSVYVNFGVLSPIFIVSVNYAAIAFASVISLFYIRRSFGFFMFSYVTVLKFLKNAN